MVLANQQSKQHYLIILLVNIRSGIRVEPEPDELRAVIRVCFSGCSVCRQPPRTLSFVHNKETTIYDSIIHSSVSELLTIVRHYCSGQQMADCSTLRVE